jgi:hypothetical protein
MRESIIPFVKAVRKIPANIPRVTAVIIMKLLSLFRHKFRHANEGIIFTEIKINYEEHYLS